MTWKPSNQPTRYNHERVAQLEPIEQAIAALDLPLIRVRKLNPIINALAMQIEDGGDNPEVNRLLMDALRAGIRHQVDDDVARLVLAAIDAFERVETDHWEQVRAGTYRPPALTPIEQFEDYFAEGQQLVARSESIEACDRWLFAWEIFKTLAGPGVRMLADVERVHPELRQVAHDFCFDLLFELSNAGLREAAYHDKCLRYVREFLVLFPDSDGDTVVEFVRAQGEALWHLDRRAEAEQIYAGLVTQLPDKGWSYIGWSDHYWIFKNSPKDYARAEAILRRALARPSLEDRPDVSQRLRQLIEQRDGKSFKNLGRNEPCWCGSGKKYKQCHLKTDQPT